MDALRHVVVGNIEEIAAGDWNRLCPATYPFARHEFLLALERHSCVGDEAGWRPRHLLAYTGDKLVGAAPMYLKSNSYGEFVFDWSWAEAYYSHGLNYYPKLVVAIPYTPATGPRLLHDPEEIRLQDVAPALTRAALAEASDPVISSLHWLFTDPRDTVFLEEQGLLHRTGYQFQWCNQGYQTFDDFLARFSSKRRKQIRRERHSVERSGISFEIYRGKEIDDNLWNIFHQFYRSTFERKSGIASLTPGFFKEIGCTLADSVLLVLARDNQGYVAGCLNFIGGKTLYGRHWGCREKVPNLHFELCYYQTIDYCIRNGLLRFDAGAQGEHKLNRGFLPYPTYSAHWIARPDFRAAVKEFLGHEQLVVKQHIAMLMTHSPYRDTESVQHAGYAHHA